MNEHLLTLLIFLPTAAAFICLFIPPAQKNAFRYLALSATLLQAVLLLLIFNHYAEESGAWRLMERTSWISFDLGTLGRLQAEYFLALDGMSLAMVALTVFVMIIATVASWSIEKSIKGYFILILVLNTAIAGSFCALDFLLFYVFFEFMLLPMYFLIGIWGGPRREYASFKFFLYTLLGSVFILVAMIGLYLAIGNGTGVHSFDLVAMQDAQSYVTNSVLHPQSHAVLGPLSFRSWAFLLLFFGFAIKLPSVPLHTWLPDAHVEAPTPVSIVLAALLLKVGAYGLIRIVWPLFPGEVVQFSGLLSSLAVLSIIYGALNAMASKDLKRMIAYSSVSHMGFVLLGITSATGEGITGAIYQMFSHGIISAMLFAIAGVLYDRTHDRMIGNYSGLSSKMPVYFTFVLIAFFASLGLPGFAGFIGEVMALLGAYSSAHATGNVPLWAAVIATLGLVLTAAYYLWTIQRMFFGPFQTKTDIQLTDISKREYIILVPLAVATIVFGIFPQLLVDVIDPFAVHLSSLLQKAKPIIH